MFQNETKKSEWLEFLLGEEYIAFSEEAKKTNAKNACANYVRDRQPSRYRGPHWLFISLSRDAEKKN
jgi:hypothetical protein